MFPKFFVATLCTVAFCAAAVPARAADDYGYAYAGRDLKRGDYRISYAYYQRAGQPYAGYWGHRYSRWARRITFVPTCYYHTKDKVIAYHYRPVFIRQARDRYSNHGRRYERGLRFNYIDDRRHYAAVSTVVPYRLTQPAVDPTRDLEERSVIEIPTRAVAVKPPQRNLQPIGQGPQR